MKRNRAAISSHLLVNAVSVGERAQDGVHEEACDGSDGAQHADLMLCSQRQRRLQQANTDNKSARETKTDESFCFQALFAAYVFWSRVA